LCEQCRPRHSPIESVRASRQPSRSSAGPIIIEDTLSSAHKDTRSAHKERDAHSQRPASKRGTVRRWEWSGPDMGLEAAACVALSVVRSCVCVVANGACGRGVEWTHKRCVVLDRTIGEAWVRQQTRVLRWSVVGLVWSSVSVVGLVWSSVSVVGLVWSSVSVLGVGGRSIVRERSVGACRVVGSIGQVKYGCTILVRRVRAGGSGVEWMGAHERKAAIGVATRTGARARGRNRLAPTREERKTRRRRQRRAGRRERAMRREERQSSAAKRAAAREERKRAVAPESVEQQHRRS